MILRHVGQGSLGGFRAIARPLRRLRRHLPTLRVGRERLSLFVSPIAQRGGSTPEAGWGRTALAGRNGRSRRPTFGVGQTLGHLA
jgi:hypothetical protein